VRLCKALGVKRVFVDAAHSLGQVPVDLQLLEQAGADYWVRYCMGEVCLFLN
jgi:selenocysteine lyase/cysteine desulfurase